MAELLPLDYQNLSRETKTPGPLRHRTALGFDVLSGWLPCPPVTAGGNILKTLQSIGRSLGFLQGDISADSSLGKNEGVTRCSASAGFHLKSV